MCISSNLSTVVMVLTMCGVALAQTPATSYNIGRVATQEDIRTWGFVVGPEGKELPPGKGNPKDGAKVYLQKCAACHGLTGTEGPFTVLVHNNITKADNLGNAISSGLEPFAPKIWDEIMRTMPWNAPGTLTSDEVYHLTAFLLFRNGVIQETDTIDEKSLPKIRMSSGDEYVPPITAPREWKPGVPRPFGLYP